MMMIMTISSTFGINVETAKSLANRCRARFRVVGSNNLTSFRSVLQAAEFDPRQLKSQKPPAPSCHRLVWPMTGLLRLCIAPAPDGDVGQSLLYWGWRLQGIRWLRLGLGAMGSDLQSFP